MAVAPGVGIGVYSTAEAARLLGVPAPKARRWLTGYSYRHDGVTVRQPPLWRLQLPDHDGQTTLGFLDLMQLRAVAHLRKKGLTPQFVRAAVRRAADIIASDHPLVTTRFRTDGRRIFLELARELEEKVLLDLKSDQWVMRAIIEPTFLDVDIENDLVRRWWPLGLDRRVVLDPERRFGRPIVSGSGVPVQTLCEAFARMNSVSAVANWYELDEEEVEDALQMKDRLLH
jgi:uncharacterized protein (DUF433 family)